MCVTASPCVRMEETLEGKVPRGHGPSSGVNVNMEERGVHCLFWTWRDHDLSSFL